MNIRDLKYITTVASVKSFSKAADICCVSQPALSMQIKKVEDALRVSLFERNGKRIEPTQKCYEVVKRAEKILHEFDALYDIGKENDENQIGELKVGAFPTVAPYLFPKIIPVLTKNFENIDLILIEEKTNELLTRLDNGELDMAFIALPVKIDSFEVHSWYSEEFYLCVSEMNSLYRYETIEYEDLKDQKILLLTEGHCMRDQALEICNMFDIETRRDFEGTSLETLKQMVIKNMGVTLIPKMAINNSDKKLKYIPFGVSEPSRTIAIVWRSYSLRESVYQKILKVLKTTHIIH